MCAAFWARAWSTSPNKKTAKESPAMRKTYKLIDLDCAHCAAKMEAAIQKIDGVSEASVSFLTQKLTVEAEDGRFEEIMKQVVKACKKVEPDCVIKL